MVAADHRSVHPNVPGVPWWGAVLIAVTAAAVGFAFDAGSGTGELTAVFAGMYVVGCVVAVLVVRQSAVFTAVVQPPVLLFISVPGAYYLFHSSEFGGLKDVLITCGYPLIVRFPLMVFTSAAVLVIGLIRWYLGVSSRAAVNSDAGADQPAKTEARMSRSLFGGNADTMSGDPADPIADEEPTPKRRHVRERRASDRDRDRDRAVDREREDFAPPRARRRSAPPPPPPRGRPVGRPEPDYDAPERPHRPRTGTPWQDEALAEARRRRQQGSRASREPQPRRDPSERRAPHDRGGRQDNYDPFSSYERPTRRRPSANGASNGSNGTSGSNGASSTHHPINQVRYRGASAKEDTPPERAGRPRGRAHQPDRWEYDI